MKSLAHALILAGAVLVGWFVREHFDSAGDPLELEVAQNQEICADETPAGYTSYPVTHWGELRGCLRVKVDSPSWAMNQNMFVRKTK